MRRVKLARGPLKNEKPFKGEDLEQSVSLAKLESELSFYRHRCSDEWFEELLEETGLSGKRIDASRARLLLLAATRRRLER